MSKFDDSESDGDLTERGRTEKDRLSKSIFQKQRTRLEIFFEGYRSFMKPEKAKSYDLATSTDVRTKIFHLLLNELDNSLTQSQKDCVARRFKPHAAPIILLNDTDQLNDIRNYLNAMDISRVVASQEKQIVDLRQTEVTPINNVRENSSQEIEIFDQHPTEIVADIQIPSLLTNNNAVQDMDTVEQLSLGLEGIMYYPQDVRNPDSSEVQRLYDAFSDIIRNREEILRYVIHLKDTEGFEMYEYVMTHCLKDQEPIIFLLALNVDLYADVFDALKQDGILNLNSQNAMKMNIFSFLLMKNTEKLYQFLLFLKKINMIDEVRSICAQDIRFKMALKQMKREIPINHKQERMVLQMVERLCYA